MQYSLERPGNLKYRFNDFWKLFHAHYQPAAVQSEIISFTDKYQHLNRMLKDLNTLSLIDKYNSILSIKKLNINFVINS